MNILDTKKEALDIIEKAKNSKKGSWDMLEFIFNKVTELTKHYGKDLTFDTNSREGQKELKTLLYYTCEELMEAANAFKNRPWSENNHITDINHVHEEIADALGFFIQFCVAIGLDAKKLTELYQQKHLVNKFRIDSKY